MPGEDKILSDTDRTKLDGIVQQMSANKEPDENVRAVVEDFKSKYATVPVKKKEPTVSPSPLESTPGMEQQPFLSEGGTSGLISTPSVLQNSHTPNNFGDFNKGLLGNTQVNNVPEPASVIQQKSITAGQDIPAGNLMAATSSDETTAKDQLNYNPEFQKTLKPEIGELGDSFMRGTNRLASSVMKAPAFIYDVSVAMQHPEVQKALNAIHMGSSEQIGNATGIHNEIANDLDKVVNQSQEEFNKKYDKPVSEYFAQGDYDKAFGLMANSVAESAPAMIAIAAGGAGGATMFETTLAGTGVFGADKMSQLDKENPEMSQQSKALNAVGTGALEGITEALPIGKLASLTKEVLLKGGEQAAKEFAKQSFIKTAGKTMARYFGVQSTEALGEMANQFGENVLDKLTGAKPDIKLTEGVVDAGIIGFGTGVAMTAPTGAIDLVKTRSAVKKAGELADQKKSLEADLTSPDVSPDIKSNLSEKIKDINEQETHLANEEKQKFNDLPEDKKSEIDNLLTQSKKMSDTITDPTISETTREVMKKDHEEVENKIDKIYEESEKIKADKQKESQTHDEWMKSFENEISPKTEEPETEVKTPIQDAVKSENRELPKEQKNIESKFAKDLDENYEERKTDYLKEHGNVFDTDNARWLSPEYKENPAELSSAVHVPAREFVTKIYKEELAKNAKKGQKNIVTFTSGGSGVGKSSLVKKAQDAKSQLIVDTNLSHFDSAVKDVNEAIDAGKGVHISYMYKDPVKAFKEGVMGGKTRGGRTVPVDVAVGSNEGSLETIKQLSEHFKGNKKVKFQYFENNGKVGKMKPLSLKDVQKIKPDYKFAKKEINEHLDNEYEQGKITEQQYRGFSGKPGAQVLPRHDGRGNREGNERGVGDLGKSSNGEKEIVSENKEESVKKPVKEKNNSKELIDEEEQIESQKDDDEASVKKLNDDIEILKGYKQSDIASKKFKAIIERAFKMKEEGKIKKPTYTKYRNIAQQVLGSKVSVDAEEQKYKIETFKEQVKKKLLGEGYKKVLMSAPGFGPKQVSDLIDLTAVAAQKAIDAGYSVKESIQRALAHIKKHPYYSKLIDEGHLKEADFNNAVTEKFNQAEEKEEPVKETEKVKKSASKKKQVEEGDIFGETRKKKTVARLEESESHKDIVDEMDEDEKFYKSINIKKATDHINKILDEVELRGSLEKLANEMLNDKNPFHEKIQPLAAFEVGERLNVIAEKEGNDLQKSAMNKLAAKLYAERNKKINVSATQTGLEAEVAKRLPISEQGLKDFVSASIGDVQNTYLSQEQQSDIKDFNKAVQEAVNEELNKIAEGTKGKEWVASVDNAIDSLKIDLTDC